MRLVLVHIVRIAAFVVVFLTIAAWVVLGISKMDSTVWAWLNANNSIVEPILTAVGVCATVAWAVSLYLVITSKAVDHSVKKRRIFALLFFNMLAGVYYGLRPSRLR